MPDSLGLSFMPGGDSQDPQNRQGITPVQQAIQTLSLRIPRVAGAASAVPNALLMSPGGSALGGNPNTASILEQLRRLFMGGGVPGPGGPMSSPGAPIPPGGAGPEPPVRLPPRIEVGDPTGPGPEIASGVTPPSQPPMGGSRVPSIFDRGPRPRQI